MNIDIFNLESNVSLRALNAGRAVVHVAGGPVSSEDLAVSIVLEEGHLNVIPAAATVRAKVSASSLNEDVAGWDETIAEPSVVWDFGDPGSTYEVASGLRGAHQDRNQAIGYRASHIYRTAGNFTINCVVYWQGQMATASVSFVSEDRPQVFSAEQTILVDPTGQFEGAPEATRRFNTWQQLLDLHPNGIWHEPRVQVLFPPNQTVDCNAGQWWVRQLGTVNVSIGCWDMNAKATIDIASLTPTWIPYGVPNAQFQAFNLNIRCGWDALTESGRANGPFSTPDANGDAIFDNISIDGAGVGIEVQEAGAVGTHPARVIVHEVLHTNHKNQIVFGNCINNGVSIVGCMVDPDDLHLYGGHARGNYTESLHGLYQRNSDGGVRFARTRYLVVQNCIIRGQAGWAPQGTPGQTAPVIFQSGMRYLSGENIGQEVLFSQSILDVRMATAYGGPGGDETRLKAIIDSCTILNQIGSTRAVEINQSGYVIQNCHIIVPDIPSTPFSGPFDNVFGTGATVDPAGVGWPIIIRNNTIEVLLSEANKAGFNAAGSIMNLDPLLTATLLEENNVLYAPNLAHPIDVGPLDRSTSGYDAGRLGPLFGWYGENGILTTEVRIGETLSIPYGVDFAGRQVSQADFAGYDGRAVIALDGVKFRVDGTDGNAITVAFSSTDILITNTSSTAWTAGQSWGIDISRGTTPEAPNPYWAWSVEVRDLQLLEGATGFQSAASSATALNIDGELRGANASMGAY